MTGVSLRNTEQESNNLDRKREREKIIPQKENPRRNSRPNPGGKIAVRGRCFHRSPGDKVWGRKCKLGGKSGRSLRSRFREHAFGPGPKCTDYGSVFLNRAFIIIIIQPPLAINEKSPRYLSILIRSRHPARPPIIPSINLFEAKNRSWIREREEKKRKKENNVFIYRLAPCIDLVDEARYAENSTAFYRSKLIYFKNSTRFHLLCTLYEPLRLECCQPNWIAVGSPLGN